MKRTKKKIILLSCSILLAPIFLGSTEALASSNEESSGNIELIESETDLSPDEINFNNFVDAVEPYIYQAEDGSLQISPLPASIEALYSENLNATRLHLQQMNADVKSGKSYTTDDLEFISRRQTRSNTPASYWWGYQYTFTNAESKNFARSMEDLAYGGLSLGAFVGAFGLGPIGPAVGTVSALYWKQLASKVRAKNTSRGTIVKITRVAVFTVDSR